MKKAAKIGIVSRNKDGLETCINTAVASCSSTYPMLLSRLDCFLFWVNDDQIQPMQFKSTYINLDFRSITVLIFKSKYVPGNI